MSQFVLAHIELPIQMFPDGTHKIHNDRAAVYFEPISQLPPIQSQSKIDFADLFSQMQNASDTLASAHGIAKVCLTESLDDETSLIIKPMMSDETDTPDLSFPLLTPPSPPSPPTLDIREYTIYSHELKPKVKKINHNISLRRLGRKPVGEPRFPLPPPPL